MNHRRFSVVSALSLTLVLFLAGAVFFLNDSQAQSSKKGVKVVNNQAKLEDGFEFKRVSDQKVQVVKKESDGPTPRRHSAGTKAGTGVNIECNCLLETGFVGGCPVVIEGNVAKCQARSGCRQGHSCVMSAK